MKSLFLTALVVCAASTAKADNLDFENGSSIVDQGSFFHVTLSTENANMWGNTTDPVKGYVFDIPKTECSGEACRSPGPIKAFEKHNNNVGKIVPLTVAYVLTASKPTILSVTLKNADGQVQTVSDISK